MNAAQPRMLLGLHGPNAPFINQDFWIIDLMGPAQTVLLMHTHGTQHGAAVLRWLRDHHNVHSFMVRGKESVYPDGRIPGDVEYSQDLIQEFMPYYVEGCRVFSICNESNWLHLTPNFGPMDFVWFMKRVFNNVRSGMPSDTLLVTPPLSFSSKMWRHDNKNPSAWILDEWLEAYDFKNSASQNDNDRKSFWEFGNYAGCTVYWQYPHQLHDPSYGTCYENIARRAGRRAVVTEFAGSHHLIEDIPLTPSEILTIRKQEYPNWARRARSSGLVERAHVYIAPGCTDHWAGYRIEPALAQALA